MKAAPHADTIHAGRTAIRQCALNYPAAKPLMLTDCRNKANKNN